MYIFVLVHFVIISMYNVCLCYVHLFVYNESSIETWVLHANKKCLKLLQSSQVLASRNLVIAILPYVSVACFYMLLLILFLHFICYVFICCPAFVYLIYWFCIYVYLLIFFFFFYLFILFFICSFWLIILFVL